MEGNEDCCFFGIDCEKLSLMKVRDCLKTTSNHLRYLKASCKGFDLPKSHLILNRAGFHLFTQAFLNKHICPRHREDHGIDWRCRRRCFHPLHGDSKAKPDRGVTAVMSCEHGKVEISQQIFIINRRFNLRRRFFAARFDFNFSKCLYCSSKYDKHKIGDIFIY